MALRRLSPPSSHADEKRFLLPRLQETNMSDNYSQHSITITLNFDCVGLPMVDFNDVEKALAESRWDEGRYPFEEEMIHVGLAKVLERAIGEGVYKTMCKTHDPRKTVPHEGQHTSPALIETRKAMQGLSLRIIDSIKKAEIGRVVQRD